MSTDDQHAYCPDCRATRPVVDTDTAYKMTSHGEASVAQTYLDCGHTINGPVITSGPVPEGAPYAGPDVAVAASTSTRDLQDARQRQRELDARGQSIWADQ